MERKVVVICLLVIFLSLLSAGLAFAAEITKIQVSGTVTMEDGRCGYPSTPASLLGMLSTLFFLLAHIGIYTAAGCICCKIQHSHPNLKWIIGLICFTLSWLAFLPAILLLLHGAFLNDQGYKVGTNSYLEPACGGTSDGVFTSGGILVLACNFLAIGYYLALRPIKGILPIGEHQMRGSYEIAMGQPQFPPPLVVLQV
ncbi:hypothetical protein GQ55_4G260500 [Panicum hallii var. hallii]|uniref:MARVEL domain-containing protein n=1 Tax=Panicum hallii var. hallii TaxID=1504633 RepID=A0A2T7E085_9POAL|nr:hypothetical protein GQ55_4G260500 [Panicum hallii var. hallii]